MDLWKWSSYWGYWILGGWHWGFATGFQPLPVARCWNPVTHHFSFSNHPSALVCLWYIMVSIHYLHYINICMCVSIYIYYIAITVQPLWESSARRAIFVIIHRSITVENNAAWQWNILLVTLKIDTYLIKVRCGPPPLKKVGLQTPSKCYSYKSIINIHEL